jgi:hypothetical protein
MKWIPVLFLLGLQAVQDPGEEEKKIRDKQAEITAFVKTSKAEKDLRIALDELRTLADRAFAIDRYELSEKLLVQADGLARILKSPAQVLSLQTTLKRTKEVHRDYDNVQKSFNALVLGNGTPEDSTIVGKFFCFVKGNWLEGLKALSVGKDEALKDIATKDLAGAETADGQIALADAWGTLGQKTPGAKDRSLYWYKKAWPGLKGVTRERIRLKFKELSQRGTKENKKLPDQWIFWSRQGGQLGEIKEIVLEDGVSPSGGRSLRVSAWAGIITSKRFPLKPGAEYTVSFWVMTDSVPSLEGNAFHLQISGTEAGKNAEIGFDVALDQPWWEKMTKTFTAPDFAANGGFNMRISFKEGRFWLDDITVVATDDRVDLMENGSFEKMR